MNLHQRDCELTALGRIIIQIKTYRQVQTDQVRLARKSNLDTYLRDHLSPLDWEL